MNIVVKVKENSNDQQIINSQTALMSIKLLAKHLKNDPECLEDLKKAFEAIVSLGNSQPLTSFNLLASIILCIAQLVASLQHESIPAIPSVMSIIIRHLSTR